MHDRLLIHVHKVEGLGPVPAAGSALRNVEILRVTAGGRNRHRNSGERGCGGVVQMATEDGTDIGIAYDVGQRLLVSQLHQDREVEDARDRWVVKGKDGAVRSRGSEFGGQPVELVLAEFT